MFSCRRFTLCLVSLVIILKFEFETEHAGYRPPPTTTPQRVLWFGLYFGLPRSYILTGGKMIPPTQPKPRYNFTRQVENINTPFCFVSILFFLVNPDGFL